MYTPPGAETSGAGWAAVYSGKDGSALRNWSGADGDHLGYAMTPLDDIDGDGVRDIAVGAVQSGWVSDFTGAGYVRV